MEKKKGEIYKFRRGGASYFQPDSKEDKHLSNYHFFAITAVHEYGYFAHMLTSATSRAYAENILMNPNHFKEIVDGFGFKYKNSHFFKRPLIKTPDLDVEKIGDLTEEGLAFIEKNKEGEPIAWAELFSS